MTASKPTEQKKSAKSRPSLQAGLLIALLVAPIPWYLAAHAGLEVVAGVLLGVTALIMIATVLAT